MADRILIVDDDPDQVRILELLLRSKGFSDVVGTTDPRKAVHLYQELEPDLVLLDLRMPDLDGFEVLAGLRACTPPGRYLPVLVTTADADKDTPARALSEGAKDFLTKPVNHKEVILRVRNILKTGALHEELRLKNLELESLVRDRTKQLWETIQKVEEREQAVRASQEETVTRLGIAAELHDDETAKHIHRMSRYCELLASAAGYDQQSRNLIRLASVMHDVGKIGTPDQILLKPGKLTPQERRQMEEHAEIGHRILSGSDSDLLKVGASIALCHHERLDGSGYPHGLGGAAIPLEARIARIADVFDALTTDRIYRKRFKLTEALRIMKEGRGTNFDPYLLDLFFDRIDDVLTIKEQYEDDDGRKRAG